ncbi:MAG: electron transfer flavoprotein subunit alpha/FixB family protein [Bryobacteraceae bacterium]
MSVLVIAEHRAGQWNRMSFETIAAAQQIGAALNAPVEAAVLSSEAETIARELSQFGVTKVYAVSHPLLKQYTADAYTAAAEQLVRKTSATLVLFPHTYQVRDFAPKLAAKFGKPLASDSVSVRVSGQRVVFVRQLFQGKLNADVGFALDETVFASIQAGAFRAAEPSNAGAPIETVDVTLDSAQIRSKPEEPFREAQRSVDLASAETIVAVGRGIKEKDNLPVVEKLAQALGAEIAASRPICDNGWLPMDRQVGSSGQTVSPKVYFAIGISGAIQHLVGMKGSKTVVAINKDENAPIFEIADYGVVGDLFEVVPALIEEVKKVKG